MLRREGYAGGLEELRRVAGKFDERARAACRASATPREEPLPLPLEIPQEAPEMPDRKQTKRQAESALVDSQMQVQWKHVPGDARDVLM